MQLAALQKSAAQAIVNIFETGSVRGNYSDVTLMRGDSGQLTYGRSQTTLASGNLYLLMKAYTERSDGAFCDAFKPYLPKLETCNSVLNHDNTFRGFLKDAGSDPVMHEVQDAFFDKVYWDPAMRSADALGVQSALGAGIVYDSTVHGSWAKIRDRVRKQHGELRDIGEDKWMAHYVTERRDWLATHPNALLHKCVYRMDAFKAIIAGGNWKLGLPLNVRGLAITADAISLQQPVRQSAEGTPRRLLWLKSPPVSGPDVAWLQERLTRAGYQVAQTGTFDEATDQGVRAFQESHDITPDGLVGPVTRSALEDLSVISPAKNPNADEPMPAIARVTTIEATVVTATTVDDSVNVAPTIVASEVHTTETTTEIGSQPAPAAHPANTAEIKDHVSVEVRSGIESIRAAIVTQQQQIAKILAEQAAVTARAGAPAPALPRVTLPPIPSLTNGRPILAAIASAVMIGFTQIRDAITWVQSQHRPAPVPTAGPATTHLPQSGSELSNFFSQAYAYIHGLLAALPDDWVFRIRVVAVLLICYALYRLGVRHFDVKRLEEQIAQAQQVEKQVLRAEQDISRVMR